MAKLFADIKGQDNAVRILSAQLESGNLSHAYIFLGAEGTGKEYLAREFAKLILCQNQKGDDCDSCVRFDHNSHPDLIVVDGREGIKIDHVREVIERINLSPNLSQKKVLLFTKAENFGTEAVNALLKTFEEPPVDSVIILTAVSEKSLPPTVLSRGQKLKLNIQSSENIQSILGKEFSPDEVKAVLIYAGGSIGEAKKMLLSKEKKEEKVALFKDVHDLISGESVISNFNLLARYDKNKGLREFFDIFATLVFEQVAKKMEGREGESEDEDDISLSLNNLVLIGHKVLKIYENLEYNINLKLAMEEIVLDNLVVQD